MIGINMCACTTGETSKDNSVSAISNETDEELLTDVVTQVANIGTSQAQKQETVYVKTDAFGSVNSVVVSNWLKNTDNTTELEDTTELKDIQNLKGKENYRSEGNKITWKTNGEDIYYRGTTDKELPICVNISYELDGKEISDKELAGQSGHVAIKLDYQNNSRNIVTINDREETIYTPFVVVSAMALDDERFSNVKVVNGTVVSDGKRNVAVGMAFPGLVDSLNGSEVQSTDLLNDIEERVEIPNEVIIEADVTDYESGMIITLITSDVSQALGLEGVDLDSNTALKDIKDSIEEFGDAGEELTNGTGKLKDGAQELADGTTDLVSGTTDLYNGVVQYTDGVGQVATGASQLDEGAGKLDDGALALKNGISEAKSGVSDLSNGVSSVEEGAKQVSEGAATINSKVSMLSEGAMQVSAGVDTLVNQVGNIAQGVGNAASAAGQISSGIDMLVEETAVTTDPGSIDTSNISVTGTISGDTASAAMLQYISQDQLIEAGLSEEQAQQVISMVSNVSSQVIPQMVDQATDKVAKEVAAQSAANGANMVKSKINAALTSAGEGGQSLQSGASLLSQSLSVSYAQMNTEEAKGQLAALSTGASQLAAGAGQLAEGTAKLSTGASSLYDGTKQLSEGTTKLNDGMEQLSDGAKTLKDGTATMKDSTYKLTSGTDQLTANSQALVDGSKTLADGSHDLVDGIQQLLEGTIKLNDGMIKFNEEGIDKLTEVFDTDLDSMKQRIQAISDAGRAYNSFGGSDEKEDSSVKFIIESAEIKK